MKGLGYFEKLSLAARWFLPREEAQEMEEDYRDILMEVEGSEEAVKRFGTPVRLARLRDRRWRAVVILCLAGLAMCIELHYLVWNCSASLWVLVRDYEAGNADWVISNIQNVTYRFLIYAGSGSVLAAIGLI